MSKVENAAALAEQIAYDDSHGYKWGGWGPEYDCGHLVIDVFERSGIPVKSVGGASYTGDMPEAFMRCGAADVTNQVNLATGAGMKRGDALVNRQNHAALYLGGGKIVQARSDLDGVPGDSSGQEIRVQGYYNYPWTHVLRFPESASEATPAPSEGISAPDTGTDTPAPVSTPRMLKKGLRGEDVRELQELLCRSGALEDGSFDDATYYAVLKYQRAAGLAADGIAGPLTMAALRGAAGETVEDEDEPATDPAEAEAPTEDTEPAQRTYTVKSGDTLWGIAVSQLGEGNRYHEIMGLNGLTSVIIHAGDVLKLP